MQTQKAPETLIFQYLLNECFIIDTLLSEEPGKQVLHRLLGDTDRLYGATGGHMRKLHHYYALLTVNAPPRRKLHAVGVLLNQALLAASESQYLELKRLVCEIAITSLQLIATYGKNRHLLLFLLRKHHEIDHMCGKGTVTRIFLSLFSKGLSEASSFLMQSFSEEGYTHLVPSIDKHFSTISNYDT